MELLYQEFRDRGLVLAAVNIQERAGDVRKWIQKEGLTFPVLLDYDGAVSRAYRVLGTPTVFLVDRAGRLVGHAVGPRGWTTATGRALIKALLEAPAG